MENQNPQRNNYLNILKDEIVVLSDSESLSIPNSAVRILLEWIGYNLEDVEILDNKDSGIDAYSISDRGIDIYQVKTHELTIDGEINTSTFDNSGVNDLMRAKNILISKENKTKISKQVKTLIQKWDYLIQESLIQENPSPVSITLNLIVLGDSLTEEANEEFTRFKLNNQEIIDFKGVKVKFDTVLYNIDDIIKRQWQEDNVSWKDINGKKKTNIKLSTLSDNGIISDSKNAILYSSAFDLVKAYDALGYQIFEPNVRAEIKRSKINASIRESIKHSRSRKEFKFLNNGVTITCESFEKPKKSNSDDGYSITIHYPGIVNGLQTVTALHTAYNELNPSDKEDFKNDASVLVRILNKKAVNDINQVVRSTNNQNPMKPRNLVSNSNEQIGYSKMFAKQLNWFYEAKEGAWNAFEKDPKRWRPSLGKTTREFKVINKVKKVDNLTLAQTWLSFIGCSSTAAEEKQHLFTNHYDLVFKKRVNKHGFYFDFNTKNANSGEHSNNSSTDARLMFVSYLTYNFAKNIVPSKPKFRKLALERLGDSANKKLNVDDYTKISTQELDGKLFEIDNEFSLFNVLSYMPLLFTEFVGFILFETFGDSAYAYGGKILATDSYKKLKNDLDFEGVCLASNSETYNEKDLLLVLWGVFKWKIEEWVMSGWKESYRGADRKQRFVLSKDNRQKLYKDIVNLDKFLTKRTMTENWALGIDEGQGLFDFVKNIID
ncbi:AIPR family protein [uncultured Maribacter sp.]|uniref:AIPR family protein n=1 Tax=uncultured Maribacter sp. TaxID=431308 RepID=UPI002614BA80|nr:AIPR family protein [uncultured Maribacter sp.]